MKRITWICLGWLVLIGSSHAQGEALFRDCEDIADDSSYRLLQKYISTRDEANDLCQRLDDNEFLYTTGDNIYYCKSDKGAPLACEESEKGHFLPDLSVVKRFTGGNDKQFVLFKTRRLSRGTFGEGYHAFFLVPKRINPRGYTVFFLPNASAADNNDGNGTCDGTNDSEAIISMNPPFEIVNENQTNVVIRFNQERTNCKTSKKSKQTLEYTWQNGSFQQTKNQIEELKTGH
jgi:hypothetical protein